MGISAKRLKTVSQPSRKQQRKEKRKEKKIRKSNFFSNKRIPGQFVLNPVRNEDSNNANIYNCDEENSTIEKHTISKPDKSSTNKSINVLFFNALQMVNLLNYFLQVPSSEDIRKEDFKVQKKLEKEMMRQRSKQLLDANKEEDKIIKQLEKQLGLNKRKSKVLPKNFVEEGLDCKL